MPTESTYQVYPAPRGLRLSGWYEEDGLEVYEQEEGRTYACNLAGERLPWSGITEQAARWDLGDYDGGFHL